MRCTYGLDPAQLTTYVIRPALRRIDLWSAPGEVLVLGTGLQESHLRWVDQLAPGPGPGYGLWQMEKPTYHDIWGRYITRRAPLREALLRIAGHDEHVYPPVDELTGNLFYGAAMCRVFYRRIEAALPALDEPDAPRAFAAYWKRFYNTHLGRGTVEQAEPHFAAAIRIVTQTGGYLP